MSDKTTISWADSTHNFWRGCTKVSAGCKNCYAETLITTRLAKAHYEAAIASGKWHAEAGGPASSAIPLWGPGAPRVRSVDFAAPLRWNKKPWVCDGCGESYKNTDYHVDHKCVDPTFHRRRVFSLSLGDIGDPEVPFQWFNDAMVIVEKCSNLDFLLLTKRPDEFLARWEQICLHWMREDQSLPKNVWVGVSCEDQANADKRIPILLQIPARIRFVSAEPLLGPIDFKLAVFIESGMDKIDWVIFGGESGNGARPCNVEWIRDGAQQCREAGVSPFVKQLGSFLVTKLTLRDKKGGDISEFPDDLKIREWPKVEASK